jgi:hypothetical protein
VLKKAGIVVAAAAAGLLAVSPLAFAGDYDGDHDGDGGHSHHDGDGHHAKKADCEQDNSSKNGDTKQSGIVNINNVSAQAPIQACDNHIGILDGAFGILGKADNTQVNK